ncbi:hypothetical protein MTO96_039809 [Rhipicephalus appendiculatus]
MKTSGGQVARRLQENNERREGKQGTSSGGNVRVARGWKRRGQTKWCAAREDEFLPAFLRRTLDRTCLPGPVPEACLRSSSGGPTKVRGPGIPGAVFVGRGLTLTLGSCCPILLGWPRRPYQRPCTR